MNKQLQMPRDIKKPMETKHTDPQMSQWVETHLLRFTNGTYTSYSLYLHLFKDPLLVFVLERYLTRVQTSLGSLRKSFHNVLEKSKSW